MADNAGCYSDLLFNDDGCFDFASSFSCDDNNTNLNAPKMLCFGDNQNCKKTDQKPSLTRIADSSSKNNNKKRNGSNNQNAGDSAGNQRNGKKRKTENSTGGGHAKGVKREKLGERISALQQLVSPFGKTDTASVLHEAFGYIRFLHDQVQVLSSPYLQRSEASNGAEKGKDDDLRSRGLCLVPVDLTVHVAHSNGADLWSSAAMIHTV